MWQYYMYNHVCISVCFYHDCVFVCFFVLTSSYFRKCVCMGNVNLYGAYDIRTTVPVFTMLSNSTLCTGGVGQRHVRMFIADSAIMSQYVFNGDLFWSILAK